MIKNIIRIACCFFVLLGSSCKESGCNTDFNYTTFKTTLSPQQSSQVAIANGWTYTEGGACGLIVYHTTEGLKAYDRCAPTSRHKLTVDGFFAVDTESGSRWLLLDGSPSAIAECPLQQYRVQKVGELIVISN